MIYFFIYLDIIGPLLALPFYIANYKRKISAEPNVLILCFLLLQLLANSWAKILMLLDRNNLYVYQVNAFISCIVVTLYILQELKKICTPKIAKGLTVYAIVSYIVLLMFILREDTSFFNALSYTFTGFTICVFCVIFYLQSLTNLKEESIIRSSGFWALTSFFFYYSISFFIFLYYNIFTKQGMENFEVLWAIHNFILFLSCLLLIIASKLR